MSNGAKLIFEDSSFRAIRRGKNVIFEKYCGVDALGGKRWHAIDFGPEDFRDTRAGFAAAGVQLANALANEIERLSPIVDWRLRDNERLNKEIEARDAIIASLRAKSASDNAAP